MNRQKGIIATIWLYVAAGIILLASLTAAITAWNSFTERLDKAGYDRGVAETTAAYQKRDNAALQAAIAAQTAAEVAAQAAERKAATAQSVASSNYQKGVKDGKAETDRLIAAGTRLRDPGHQAGSGPACGGQAGTATVTPGPTGSHGAEGSFLSGEATKFLLNLTNEADETAKQLAAAQAIIVSDRVTCNAP